MFQLDLLEEKTDIRKSDSFDDEIIETSLKEIAIVGISAKLPQAQTHNEFWDVLLSGIDCVGEFPESRRRELEPYLQKLGAMYNNISIFDGAYLDDISSFDYSFFRLSPKEASLMSPNQRLFLQTACNALEDGGYGGEALQGTRTGVFIGHNADALHDYKRVIEAVNPEALSLAAPGNLSSMIASRISYLLNLRGPAISVDTACSSSLVAVHLACQSIRSGECDMALAGSVKINLLPLDIGIRLGIESSDNRAKPFDDSSDGTGIGDGVVAMLLKPLSTALQDGDHIYAVIKGSATNQDGSSVGITAPNALAQEDVIVRAWEAAGIDPETVTYMEAHGTGTTLGDPIEVDGITRAFSRFTDKMQFCAIGSIKSNIGHLDHAAGIAGLLKGILSLYHKQLPPTLHFRFPNRKISFIDSPLYVNNELMPWSDENGARRCGVSAFGMSGTNCHVVLEEAPLINNEINKYEVEDDVSLLCLSGHSKGALKHMIQGYREWISARDADSWSIEDLCFTAATGRGHYKYRLAIVAADQVELRRIINSLDIERIGEMNALEVYYGFAASTDAGISDEVVVQELLDHEASGKRRDRGMLIQIAERYVAGARMDWARMYSREHRQRIPIPVYPFDRHSCWVEESSAQSNSSPLSMIQDLWTRNEVPVDLRIEMEEAFASWRSRLQQQEQGQGNEEQFRIVSLLGECGNMEVGQSVADVWGEILGYGELHTDANFYELGGDSIIALKIMNRLSERWDVRLEVVDILANPVLGTFADAVTERRLKSVKEVEDEAIIILPIPSGEHYVISSPQQRMYLQQLATPDDRSYNLPELLHMDGDIDASRLEASIQTLIQRHEMLRTSFAVVEGEIRQFVHERVPFTLTRLQVTEEELPLVLQNLFVPFDLNQAPLLYATLLTISSDQHVLFLDLHHIASDGMSAGILLGELVRLYRGELLEPLKLQYRDYAAWQQQLPQSERMERQGQFWMNQCKGEWPVLQLPTDFPRPPIKSSRGETFDLYVDAGLAASIRELAKGTESTLFMVLLTAYYTLLAKYTGGEDFAVGTPISGRVNREVESVVGMFVGTLVLRGYPQADKTFLQFLAEVKATAVKAYENADFPFEKLVQLVDRRDTSRNPLFDTMFIMQNLNTPDFSGEGLTYKHERFPHGTAKYDLMIQAVEGKEGIRLVVEYCTDLFRLETVQTFMRHYISLLKHVTSNPGLTLADCEMLSAQDYTQLLSDFGSRDTQFDTPRRFQESFEEQARWVPESCAVQHRGQSITYRELNERTNRLARRLQQSGVGAHTIVGVMAERSIPMLIGMIAIMKAGGAYLPIDSNFPQERIDYLLSDSETKLLLTDRIDALEVGSSLELIALDGDYVYEGDGSNLELAGSVEDPMYVIYTSGSTGEPKGVVVSHRSFFNFGHSLKRFYRERFDERDRCLSLTNISFDVSVCELFMPLMFGASVILYPEPKLIDPRQLASVIVSEGVTFAYIPPTMLKDVARALEQSETKLQLNKMLVGVEPIKDETLELFVSLNPNICIVNGYGPTEATICSNMYVYKSGAPCGKTVPIGGPMHGVEIYILGFGDRLAPIGVTGELCIAGSGLALGYYNKPELTASRFVQHPMLDGKLLYRTGDLAKWLPDGNAMYLGRLDHQIKIRGIRVELGEIQTHLLRNEAVDEAFVIATEDNEGDKSICAYIVLNRQIEMFEIKNSLKSKLPDYMIPSYLITMDAIPLTPNGKVDRKALPEPSLQLQEVRDVVLPRTTLEANVAEVWQDVLGFGGFSIYDDFFELGGHSLKAAVLAGRIHEKMGIEVPLGILFQAPTVASMAAWISEEVNRNEGQFTPTYERIQRQPDRAHYPMSRAQRRLYLLGLFSTEDTAYNLSFVLHMRGRLDVAKLEEAFGTVIMRHETLRTTFHYEGDEFNQCIHSDTMFELENFELSEDEKSIVLSDATKITSKAFIDGLMLKFIKPFSLETGPLLRVGLVSLEQERHLLLLDMHHIVSDGVSVSVLVKELTELYSGNNPLELPVQYRDYSVWQEQRLQGETYAGHEEHWLQTFKGELPVLELPTDKVRPSVQSYEGQAIIFTLNTELAQGARRLAREYNTTLYTVLLGAYAILLGKYSGQEDIAIGTPVAGRSHVDVEGLIGMFVNTVAIRTRPEESRTLGDYVTLLHHDVLLALEHQEYPFEELVERLGHEKDQSRNPLFDTMFILQNMNQSVLEAGELTFEQLHFDPGVSKFDLTMVAAESGNEIVFTLEYATSLFHEETIQRLARHYRAIVREMTVSNGPIRRLGDLVIMDDEEKAQLLTVFNRYESEVGKEGFLPADEHAQWVSILTEIEKQAERTPNAAAIQCGAEQMTYRELNERANNLAHTLRSRGVGPERIVALMADRSPLLLVAILGILKAGGAYVAIDPSYPAERIGWMLEDCGEQLLLTERAYAGRVRSAVEEWYLDDPDLYAADRSNLETMYLPDHLAYVLYTSGSTGRPKGAMIEHRGLASFVKGFRERLPMAEGQGILAMATISFDIFIVESLLPLTLGMRIVLANEEERNDAYLLQELMAKYKVDVLQITPSRFKWWMAQVGQTDSMKALSVVMIGAEPLTMELLNRLSGVTQARIFNLYGPTETTVWTSVCEVTHGEAITIGTPIAGAGMVVLNAELQPQPIGVVGELYIGGSGVGRGYLSHPEWNEGAFIANPFREGERMYRTGDLGRRLANGEFVYAGRRDHQVKIRGHRIEIGEVEQQVLSYERVKEAVVVAFKEADGEHALCAYVVIASYSESDYNNQPLSGIASELRQHLSGRLPAYMIPVYVMPLEFIPLTPTGKVDRKALPKPQEAERDKRQYLAPRNETEHRLAVIWQELLQTDNIGATDSFFELGGHSLKAAGLVSRLQEQFGVHVPLRALFLNPTLESLASIIDGENVQKHQAIERQGDREHYPMSRAQRRQYMLQLISGEATMYHVPFALQIRGKLDVLRLEGAFAALIARHESLRTTFHYMDGEFRQRIHPVEEFEHGIDSYGTFQLEKCVLERVTADKWVLGSVTSADYQQKFAAALAVGLMDVLMAQFVRPFDLGSGPLLRAGLVQLDKERHLLLLDMHHIVTDGVSVSVLLKELTPLYSGHELPELRVQYRDYSAWQEERLSGGAYEAHECYWLETFSGELPVLELPNDKPRPVMQSYEGQRYAFKLDAELAKRAHRLAREQGTTLYTVLLSAYVMLLGKYSGQEDIVIGTPVAGRGHVDVEGLIGMFINTVAIRSRPQAGRTVGSYIKELHGDVLLALEHQEYPFEDLVERLDLEQDQSHNPLFDTMFILQNMERSALQAGDLTFESQPFEPGVSKFDLTLEAVESGAEIVFSMEYATALFHEETIVRMAHHYCAIVREMTADGGIERTLGELELLNETERLELLDVFESSIVMENRRVINVQKEDCTTDWDGCATKQELPQSATSSDWKSILVEIENQAARTPDAAAIQFGVEQMTYRELNERANSLAHTLRSRGVGAERIVALMADRSPLLLVAILGILKAGGAYVAIDPSYPAERIGWMLEDCGEQLLLTERAYAGRVRSAVEEWYLDDPDLYAAARNNLESVCLPDHLAYVLYTSGSTGRPKGAMIEHRGLASFVKGFRERLPLAEGQGILAMATVSFDIFIVESLLPLTLGMRIVLANEEERNDAYLLQMLMAKYEVDVLQITPSRFKWWMAQVGQTDILKSLSVIMIGAEPLTTELLNRLRAVTQARIFNLYGPTETTVWTSVCEVTHGEAITIGTPIAGAGMVVLNAELQPQPIGVVGELYIGGSGVGRGYLSHPEWNVGAFIPNPFHSGERMYRTGDLGRRLANGEFVYAGRRDHQVKIRGHRIEIGEVEQQVLSHERVKEAVVMAFKEVDGEYALCAYVVMDAEVSESAADGSYYSVQATSEHDGTDSSDEHGTVVSQSEHGGRSMAQKSSAGQSSNASSTLRGYLGGRLPAYMIPAYVMPLEAIPLTPTGKVDRKALPKPQPAERSERQYTAPRNETEHRLAVLWQELLQTDNIGATDSFFELGGHSLKAAALVSRLQEQFGVHVPLRALFLNPTLESLAVVIEGEHKHAYQPIQRQEDQEYYPMSRAQRRQYVLQLISGEATMYHVPFALQIRGKLEAIRLERAFAALIARHESLRTTFHYMDGEFRQRVHPAVAFEQHVHSTSVFKLEGNAWARMTAKRLLSESGMDEVITTRLMARFIRSFDLGSGPLLRAGLVPLDEDRHLLLLDMHHIVTDGISVSVLLKELTALYSGQELPELRVQYRDYSAWQEERLSGEMYEAHERYWLETFSGELPVLELPNDKPRSVMQSYEGQRYAFKLDAELAQRAHCVAREQGTTLYTVLLSAYAVLLGRYSGQEDIVIGTPVAGRGHVDVEGLIGMFINTVAIRSHPQSGRTVGSYVKELHGDVLLALEHQEYPFEDLVERLDLEQDQSRNPLFDTMFILQNMERSALQAGEMTFESQPFEQGVSKFDLTLEAVESGEEIVFSLEYATALFHEETIVRMAHHYCAMVREITAIGGTERTIGELILEDGIA
ncbi:non-ribosomal peptide synthetase [Paenibacillus sp. IHBB 10380]|uniref:non-ribosomal peptide synthetase n=1 Tax=Paenibacillus sp. IHBB 10380 TaxID=1566358 RepID=UPI0009E2C96D|nr:non-ribosomal peptide synthetase [Paenibacillus sp. IHBB 10380]